MGFSFFGVSYWGQVEVRGRQVAERIGGKFNPTEGFEDDVCIFVGSRPRFEMPLRTFLDPGEKRLQLHYIAHYKQIRVISWSNAQFARLTYLYPGRPIHLVPQHHCNFENEQRPNRPILKVGVVGPHTSVYHPLGDISDRLEKVGFKFYLTKTPRNQREAADAYKELDIQLVFRNILPGLEYRSPLKVINAGSFGIPTVAFPEPAFEMEAKGAYLPATTIEELVEGAVSLATDPSLYRKYVDASRALAENYHIDKILPYYRKLEEVSFP
jgi:hypothetical protein